MSLKHAILVLLETEPSSGYDLLKQFKKSLGYFWNAKHQQIYQQLKILTEDGLIACETEQQGSKPDKKIYKITLKGIEEIRSWLTFPVEPNKINDALLVKLYGGHLTNPDNLLSELIRHTSIHQQTLSKLLAIEETYLALPENTQKRYYLPYITLRRGIIGEQAWLDWSQEAIRMIKK
jgi:PadR family transcriptional regulator AphA